MKNRKYLLLILSLIFINYLNLNATVFLKDNTRQLFPQKAVAELDLTYKYVDNGKFMEIYDEDGKLLYKDKSYIPEPEITSSTMKVKIIEANNKKLPIVETYYPNGKLRSMSQYDLKVKDEDIEKNDIRKFYTSGKIGKDIFIYVFSEIYFEDGSLKLRMMQKGNKAKMVKFYENGNKASEVNLVIQKVGEITKTYPYGIGMAYYPNGILKSKIEFKEGMANGIYETYYENGKLSEKTTMKDGKPDGKYEFYNYDGELMGNLIYKNGEVVNN